MYWHKIILLFPLSLHFGSVLYRETIRLPGVLIYYKHMNIKNRKTELFYVSVTKLIIKSKWSYLTTIPQYIYNMQPASLHRSPAN